MVHCVYVFLGILPLTEFCQLQNSLRVQLLRSPKLSALLHGTRALHWPVSQSLRVVQLRNGITEVSHRVPPIFGRLAITVGISPCSSFVGFTLAAYNVITRDHTVLPATHTFIHIME